MKKMGRQMGWVFFVFCFWFLGWWSAFLPYPAGHDSLFFVLPKKSKQKKGAPEMATSPWICVAGREGRQTRCAQTASPLFPPRNKNPRRHQGLNVKRERPTHRAVGLVVCPCAQTVWLLSFDFPCPRWRLEFLLQGGKRGEACLSEASLPPLPPCDRNSRNGSPSRARISLLTFFGQDQRK